MNRALELCDAYYGDPSSVAHLCENSGKPVMIQNSKVKNMNHPFMRCFPLDRREIFNLQRLRIYPDYVFVVTRNTVYIVSIYIREKCLYVMGRDGSLICHDKNRSHEEYALAYDYCNGILYERYMGKQYLFDRNESVLYEVQENGQVREYSFQ